MSAPGGSIKHLHDDLDLSFHDLKTIFLEICTGKKPVTEKIDGFKAFFTFLPDSQELRIATTKKDVEKGGLIVKELKNTFSDNENFAQALTEASKIIQNRLKSVSITEQRRLFGYRGDIFYNCEILHPTCNNVFSYDNTKVVVHRSSPYQQNIQLFEQILSDSNDFCVNPSRNLDIFEGFSSFRGEINEFMKAYDLKSTSTIGDFVTIKLTEALDHLNLPEFNRRLLVKRIMGKKGTRINYIRQHLTLEQLGKVDQIIADKKRFLSEAMGPIRNIIINNSINILNNIESRFIPNIEIQSQSIKESIKENPLFENVDFENFSIKNEGIVFEHSDKVYKLTGHFSEINKVLGYTGGDKEVIIERPMRYCFIPGKFKPPHAGHFQLAKYFADKKDVDEVYVIVSTKERPPVTVDMSVKLWELYTKDMPNVKIMAGTTPSPVGDVYELIADNAVFKEGDTALLGKSEKDADDARFDRAQSYAERKNPGVKVEPVITPLFAGGVSGTQMRQYLVQGEEGEKEFKKNLPRKLSAEEKDQAYEIVTTINDNINRPLDDMIDEISSMAGGAVAGYAGGFGRPNKFNPYRRTKKPKVKRAKRQRRR